MVQLVEYSCKCYQKEACFCCVGHREKSWKLNLEDVAEAIAAVLRLFGISLLKVRRAIPVIIRLFREYKKSVHRIDMPARKCFNKKELMYQLGTKCNMSRSDAQLSYSVIKRAFRAFYYATDQYGFPDEAQLELEKHTSECYWVHAARQSAHIFAKIEGMFPATERIYALKIKCIYKHLFDQLKARFVVLHGNKPRRRTSASKQQDRLLGEVDAKAAKGERFIFQNLKTASTLFNSKMHEQEVEEEQSVYEPRCSCPKLECDCSVNLFEEVYAQKYSQGTYLCYWKPNYDDVVPDDFVQQDKICTSSLYGEEEEEAEPTCDAECFCTCEICECCCESTNEDVSIEGIEEDFYSDDNDPCTNLRELLGPPSYPPPPEASVVAEKSAVQAADELQANDLKVRKNEREAKKDGELRDERLKKEPAVKTDLLNETVLRKAERKPAAKSKKKDAVKKQQQKADDIGVVDDDEQVLPEAEVTKIKRKIQRKVFRRAKKLPCCPECVRRKRSKPGRRRIVAAVEICDGDSEFPDYEKYKT